LNKTRKNICSKQEFFEINVEKPEEMLAGIGQQAGKSSVQVWTCPPPSSEVIACQGIFGYIFADSGVYDKTK
jgi:hypothetical protein